MLDKINIKKAILIKVISFEIIILIWLLDYVWMIIIIKHVNTDG